MLENMPTDSFTLFAIAKEHEKSGEANLALEFYERLRTADPDYVGLYYHLGKLHERNGNPERALDVYRKGMEVAKKSGDFHALSELAGARLEIDDEDG